jgi:hypothetical protein
MPKTIEISYFNPCADFHDGFRYKTDVKTLDSAPTKVELDKMLREAWNKNVADIKSKMEGLKNDK